MTRTEHVRLWTARLLLGFVLVTIGFAAGRRTAPASTPSPAHAAVEQEAVDQVIVYAAHMTFRCPECTQIERLARELIENEFAEELADGSLEFKTVDYMRDTAFARKYNISSSTIIVVRIENGQEQAFQRLDKVWTKVQNRNRFFDYVRDAVRKNLEQLEERETA